MADRYPYPRIVVAGSSGGAGKTIVSLALARACQKKGIEVQCFKKGPDYIDAGWLSFASEKPARNLDLFLMGEEACLRSFVTYGTKEGINIIEGNKGILDGVDAKGSFSTKTLAQTLEAPIILVANAHKVTATLGAIVKGVVDCSSNCSFGGVILNRVAGERHKKVVSESIKQRTGLNVIGAIPGLDKGISMPERHLGLLPVLENTRVNEVLSFMDEVAGYIDLEKVLEVARSSTPLAYLPLSSEKKEKVCRIGVLKDSAFSFYYPENLEALEAQGAELVFFSPLSDTRLDHIDALYIGGGFPETHLEALSRNASFRKAVEQLASSGLPIYAECGGLMFLSRSIDFKGKRHEMCDVLPLDIEMLEKPVGHGYATAVVDKENPFYPVGATIKGHEFHYSRPVVTEGQGIHTTLLVQKGTGVIGKRDGIVMNSVFATYIHVHALGEVKFAEALAREACAFKARKNLHL
jgi:cobyrinic acid a,c-diamide synthase